MSDIPQARHLHIAQGDIDNGGTPRIPDVVSWYTIEQIPQYKFDSESVIETVQHLLAHGAQPITIRRMVDDLNFPSVPQPLPPVEQQVIDFVGQDGPQVIQ